jgi:hypothetical protein
MWWVRVKTLLTLDSCVDVTVRILYKTQQDATIKGLYHHRTKKKKADRYTPNGLVLQFDHTEVK